MNHESFSSTLGHRGVTIHLVTIRFVLRYTACDILNDTIFTIHISDILYIQELSIGEDFRRQDLWLDWLQYVVWVAFRNKEIPNFYSTERSHLCCLSFEILIELMFLCTYIALKASSCVTFIVIYATRASIVCIDSGTCDTIRVSLALAIRFFDISINRYTPTGTCIWSNKCRPLLCWGWNILVKQGSRSSTAMFLMHCGLVTPYDLIELGQHWCR